MKYFLIGFAIWFALAFLPQLIKAWIWEAIFQWKKRHYKGDDAWTYHI